MKREIDGTILGPSGRPMTRIGGPAAFREFEKAGVRVSLQWFTDRAQHLDEEPSMMLTYPKVSMRAYCIPLRDLHQFVERGNYNTPHGLYTAYQIAKYLGIDQTSQTTMHAIIDILYETLPDLLKMPPKPEGMRLDGTAERAAVAVSFHEDGKQVSEQEIMQ